MNKAAAIGHDRLKKLFSATPEALGAR
jgi:hypothetical protein